MREDEYHTRRLMPVMRRVVVLAAVVTAVPVVMWTVTEFVRNYLGPPQAPSIQTMTAAPVATATEQATAAPADNPPAATAEDTKTAQQPTAPAVNVTSNPPAGNGNGGGPAITITSSVPAAANTPAAVPVPVPRPAAAAPAKIAMSNPAANSPANPTPSAVPLAPAAAPNDIWPTPPMGSAATEPPVAPSADALPQSEPIAGRVPLPRKRPSSFVFAQAGTPLPRPRPLAAAPSAAETPSPFEWLHNLFQPSSPAAAAAPQQNLFNAH